MKICFIDSVTWISHVKMKMSVCMRYELQSVKMTDGQIWKIFGKINLFQPTFRAIQGQNM